MSWLSNPSSIPRPNAWNAGPAAGAVGGLATPVAAGLAGAGLGVGGGLSMGAVGVGAGLGGAALGLAPQIAGGALAYRAITGGGNGAGNNNNNSNNGTGVGGADWDSLNRRIQGQEYKGAFNDQGLGFTVNAAPWVNQGPDSISDEYRQMIDEGKSSGLSNWGNAAYNRSRADQGYALEDARSQSLQDAGQGMNSLAMQGGLESGAAENMLRNAGQNANKSRTDLYRQGSMDRMGIDVADASRKDQMRTQGLAGSMDVARYDTDVQNINVSNKIADLDKRNQFDAGKLGMEGQMMGARAVSNAYLNGGGGNSTNGGMFSGVMNRTGNPQQDIFNMNPITGLQATRQNVGNFWNSGGSF